jgi:hypothetical protein
MAEEDREEAKRMVEQLSRFVNSFGCPYKEFAEEVMREHRTLQQSMFRLFITCIYEWAALEHFDLRNEHTVKTCKSIVGVLGKYGNGVPMV